MISIIESTRLHVPHPYGVNIRFKEKGSRKTKKYTIYVRAYSKTRAEKFGRVNFLKLFKGRRATDSVAFPCFPLNQNSLWGKTSNQNPIGVTFQEWKNGTAVEIPQY